MFTIQKYQQWKENLPDFSWIKDLIPDETKQNNFKDTLSDLKQKLITENRFLGRLAENTEATIRQFREMLREKQQRQQGVEHDSFEHFYFFYLSSYNQRIRFSF